MKALRKFARCLAVFGSVVLLVGAVIQFVAGYPEVSRGVSASNLSGGLGSVFRAVFLLAAWHRIAIAAIALVAALSSTAISRAILLICGVALLADAAVMLRFLGWFIGTDVMVVSALAIFFAGLLFAPPA